jgi:phage portal protein BeeE
VALVASFLRDQAAMQLSITKSHTYCCLQCSRANLKRYCKIPFSVNQKSGNNRESKPNHPAHKLVSFSPNSNDHFIFRKTMAISLLLRGNALARIVYDASGNPIETIFINWDKVTDIRINKGELLYYVQGFTNPLLASEYCISRTSHTTES